MIKLFCKFAPAEINSCIFFFKCFFFCVCVGVCFVVIFVVLNLHCALFIYFFSWLFHHSLIPIEKTNKQTNKIKQKTNKKPLHKKVQIFYFYTTVTLSVRHRKQITRKSCVDWILYNVQIFFVWNSTKILQSHDLVYVNPSVHYTEYRCIF